MSKPQPPLANPSNEEKKMSKIIPPVWIKNKHRKEPWFFDGDEFLVAVLVNNNKIGRAHV